MSTYVMSDLHGEYEKFQQMLKKIRFSDEDVLYVLGDILDRGPEPVKLLWTMSLYPNIFPILGNHELMALDLLTDLTVEISEENYATQITPVLLEKLRAYQQNGGEETLRQFQKLPYEDRYFLLDYLREFTLYEQAEAGGKRFLLVHSGHISAEKPLSAHTPEELTFLRADYENKVFDDIYIVSGHTPTLALTGKAEILCRNNHINIDCGAVFGGRLACLRLEDLEEFYI